VPSLASLWIVTHAEDFLANSNEITDAKLLAGPRVNARRIVPIARLPRHAPSLSTGRDGAEQSPGSSALRREGRERVELGRGGVESLEGEIPAALAGEVLEAAEVVIEQAAALVRVGLGLVIEDTGFELDVWCGQPLRRLRPTEAKCRS